jgi:hypothetical protein
VRERERERERESEREKTRKTKLLYNEAKRENVLKLIERKNKARGKPIQK